MGHSVSEFGITYDVQDFVLEEKQVGKFHVFEMGVTIRMGR